VQRDILLAVFGCGSQPIEELLSAVDGGNILLDNEALAWWCRASAWLVSPVPWNRPDVRRLKRRTTVWSFL